MITSFRYQAVSVVALTVPAGPRCSRPHSARHRTACRRTLDLAAMVPGLIDARNLHDGTLSDEPNQSPGTKRGRLLRQGKRDQFGWVVARPDRHDDVLLPVD